MEKPKWELGLMQNPAFLKYLDGLPTHQRRILAVPDETGADKYVVSDQIGDAPPVIHADSNEEEEFN
jgi:hypothetical protein